ncbi:MAG TPA: DUF4062 domain-containing protein, partial [Thermoanaerobaculia bacterium]|nr:DUF4062 domain-containing protein [Thermoanaerobaculia bacterium]
MNEAVFLSSTRKDLIPYREAVSLALRKRDYHPIEMETFGARDEEPLQACLQEVLEAELFVGIYGWRYGFVPEGSTVSITEEEYREALRVDKPCFCFLVDESFHGLDEHREPGEAAASLARFKALIQKEETVSTFTTPDSLALAVVTALDNWKERKSAERRSGEPRPKRLETLLQKVETYWVEGVLWTAVPDGRLMNVAREECPELVGRSRDLVLGEEAQALRPGLVEPIYHLFLRRQRQVLILGRPGSGKTFTLLQLTRALVALAERDPREPVPVVFDLGSWGERSRSLTEWMVQELDLRYKVAPDHARDWLDQDRILPILDRLDEVVPECRPACVDAINSYRGGCGLAVCCSTEVYERLLVRLDLETAVALRPLTVQQVDGYLAGYGPGLEALRSAVGSDPELCEMARLPLILSLMSLTYANVGSEELARSLGASTEDRLRRILEAYVERMLESEPRPWPVAEPVRRESRLPWKEDVVVQPLEGERRSYPPERTRRWLAWLACRMKEEHTPGQFHLEQLQPSWLATAGQRWTYALLSRGAGGTLLALPPALVRGEPFFLALGLLAGLLAGAMDAPRLQRRSGGGRRGWPLIAGLLTLLVVVAIFHVLEGARSPGLDVGSLAFGLACALAFGSRGPRRDGGGDVLTTVAIDWQKWSWRGAGWGALGGVLASLACWGVHKTVYLQDAYDLTFPLLWIFLSAALGGLGAVWGGLLGGLGRRVIDKSSKPNRGIWLTFRNALVVALWATPAAALLLVPPGLLAAIGTAAGGFQTRDFMAALLYAPALGLWIGLWYSGFDWLQHFTLRLLLRLRRAVPARLIRFLDYCAERDLL